MFNPQYYFRPESKSFVFTVKTDNAGSASTRFQLPLVATGTYNFTVDKGNGDPLVAINSWNSPSTLLEFGIAGTYTVTIRGTITGWQFFNTGDRLKLLSITKWGQFKTGNVNNVFDGCSNLDLTAVQDILDLTGTTNLGNLFLRCTTLTTINRLNEWDVSGITNFNATFSKCINFNQDIGNWNVSSGVAFIQMFECLFTTKGKFNNGGSDGIKNWQIKTTSSVNFTNMFSNTEFNQPIGSWNTSAVTNMTGMFQSATSFNQNIGSWNVSNTTDFTNFMFGKSSANFSSSNMDALINGWINYELKPNLSISFGTITRTSASDESRRLMVGTSTTKTVTNVVNNGSGLIRITSVGHGLVTGNKCFIKNIVGTTEANGLKTVTVIDADTFDINGSTFINNHISGGIVITNYGWSGLPT